MFIFFGDDKMRNLLEQIEKLIEKKNSVDIVDRNVSKRDIARAWPVVTYKGNNLFDIVYGNIGNKRKLEKYALKHLPDEYEKALNEVYLGYNKSKDKFIIGYDVFNTDFDLMESVYVVFKIKNNIVVPVDFVLSEDSVYVDGDKNKVLSNYIDVRLD